MLIIVIKYMKTVNMIYWVFRFIYNRKNPNTKYQGALSVIEIDKAEMFIFKVAQPAVFSNNYNKFKSLVPFKDGEGLLGVKTQVSLK